jgi:hypothetical protein
VETQRCCAWEVYQEPDGLLREHAPDRRSFLLECGDGVVRRIVGYRGGPGPLEHRALPVVDARLLVNLVANPARGRLLDTFAGAGGLLREARAAGWTTLGLDVDPLVRHGLAEIADFHLVGDARALPLATGSIDVATEPPTIRLLSAPSPRPSPRSRACCGRESAPLSSSPWIRLRR